MELNRYWQPIIICLILIISCAFAHYKYGRQTKPLLILERKDKSIILGLSLFYTLLSFYYLGNSNHFPGWQGNYVNKSFSINLKQPSKIAKLYYYYGQGDGNLQLEYATVGNHSQVIPFNNNLALYKWMSLDLPNIESITQLKISVVNPGIELKQLALFNDAGQLITDFSVEGNDDSLLLNQLVVRKVPYDYKNTLLSSMYFDEVYYARTANEYIRHLSPYAWVHPPLGMLIVAIGILLFGMNPFGWRFMPNLAGICLIPAIYLCAKRVFANRRSAVIASLLLMFEFMHFSLSREASIDSSAALFILMEYYFLYNYLDSRLNLAPVTQVRYSLFFCGIFLGLGIATKWEAVFSIFTLIPVLLYCEIWLIRPKIKELLRVIGIYSVLLLIIPLSIYALSYIPYFLSNQDQNFLEFIFRVQGYMLEYHTHYAETTTHPYASNWWTWPLLLRPLSVYFWQDNTSGIASSVVLMGNPAIWWPGLPTAILILGLALTKPRRQTVFLSLAIVSLYGPWAFVGRLSFIYYFYEVIPFWILGLTYIFQTKPLRNRPLVLAIYLLMVAGLFMAFYPVLSGLPFPRSYVVNFLQWFASWNF